MILTDRARIVCAVFFLSLSSASLAAQPSDSALLSSFRWRNIGPASMGGRVVDIEAVDSAFATVYVASASGGVFKSVNAGTTWTPIFDNYPSASIGDIAIFQPNPQIVWVGTGEANNGTGQRAEVSVVGKVSAYGEYNICIYSESCSSTNYKIFYALVSSDSRLITRGAGNRCIYAAVGYKTSAPIRT